ncbi:TonB-dependent siderophore receptor [Alphaproteobacteria bacterium]|nr:TonB-dependent siderophore receptor [Alphaproteobacteria bacterium]MDA8625008.1 TonB-dependent siderophore receptor [Alphaproteobacteria bacterium]MDA8642778.1 TonB-dependent siderophore receptor [Alphaproteobacteria bacterium]MDB2393663.1 TonB-dependent siderophore receptor [Alphaproteobacteria bacterium]MDB2431722.1 TonB-dependent siderophore receptor [Alphaproteobacteria bacterium]
MPFKFKTGLLIASIASIASMPAVAQSTLVDEIVVTSEYNKPDTSALKMPIPLVDVPQSLTIIGQEEIKLRGYGELGDLVRYTPGVNTSQGEGHRDAIVFRGVRSTADFFIDGVRDDVQYYRPLYNLEQVEILRGPNAMLFGRGSTGGALNRVTKKAVIGADAASADLSIDSFGAYNLAADVNMTMSADSALRINAFVETLENDRDYYDGDRSGINPTYRRAIDNQTTLDLSVELMDHERFIDRGIPTGTNGAPVDSLRDTVFGSASLNTQTLEATIFRGTLTREFSDSVTGVFNVHYADYEKMYQNLYASGYDGTAGTVTLDGYRDPTDRTHMIINGHITNQFTAGGMSHTLLVGGEYIDTENKNHRFNSQWSTSGSDKETFALPASGSRLDITTNSANAATTVNFDQDLHARTETDITATSFFVQDQIAINDKLQVLLGARFDDFELTLRDTEDPAAVTSEDRTWDEVSPRFGLIYKPQSNVSLYASSSETFMPRSGEQYKAVKAAALDPDEYENTEYGVKWDVSDELTVTASMFEQEAETESSVAGEGFIQQLEVDGFELQVNGKISDRTSVSFGYSDMDGEAGDGGTAYEVPETMYSLFIDHQASERLSYGIGLTYQDESIIKQKSRKSEPQPYMPDYTRIDASLSYVMSDDTTVRVFIENLADEDYYPHSHATHQVSVGDPTNAKISLSRKF